VVGIIQTDADKFADVPDAGAEPQILLRGALHHGQRVDIEILKGFLTGGPQHLSCDIRHDAREIAHTARSVEQARFFGTGRTMAENNWLTGRSVLEKLMLRPAHHTRISEEMLLEEAAKLARQCELPGIPAEDPAAGGYSSLQPNKRFKSLRRVPLATGGYTDVSRYPARRGFEDILTYVNRPIGPFAWNAVTYPKQRYVFFTLKDPAILPQTVLWVSNGGRHYAPWNGRHVNIMGIEDVCSYFHFGLKQSAAPNPIARAGSKTCHTLKKSQPLSVNYIMATAKIPAGFDRVKTIKPAAGKKKTTHVTLTADSGKKVTVPLDHTFLRGE